MSTPSVCGAPLLYAIPDLTSYPFWIPFAEKRKGEAERIRQKYPDRIPVRATSL